MRASNVEISFESNLPELNKANISVKYSYIMFFLFFLLKGSRTIRKSAKVVTMSLEGGYPLSLAFGGTGVGGGSDDFLSLAFGGKFSHKFDHFWPN